MGEFSWSKVFNPELKKRWLYDYAASHSLGTTLITIHTLLMNLAPYEYEKGADVCTWDNPDYISSVMYEISPTTTNTRRRLLSLLRSYVQWCLDNNIPNTSAAIFDLEFKESNPRTFKSRSVTNPKQLQAYLRTVLGDETRLCEDLLRRCYAWFAFSGIPIGKAADVRTSDVRLDRMEIVYGGITYRLYYEGLSDIRTACSSYWYERYVGMHWSLFQRTDNDTVLRGMSSDTTPEQRERLLNAGLTRCARLALLEKKTDKRLTYRDIHRSGVFYRVYEDEMAGFPVDFTAVIGLFGINPPNANHMRHVAGLYRADYETWKATMK